MYSFLCDRCQASYFSAATSPSARNCERCGGDLIRSSFDAPPEDFTSFGPAPEEVGAPGQSDS